MTLHRIIERPCRFIALLLYALKRPSSVLKTTMASSEAVVVASIVGNGEAIEDKSSTFIALGYDNDKYYYSEQAASIFHYNKKYRVTPFPHFRFSTYVVVFWQDRFEKTMQN